MLTRLLKALPLGVLIAITGLAISFFQFAHNDTVENLNLPTRVVWIQANCSRQHRGLRSLRVRSHGRYAFTDGRIKQALGNRRGGL